MAATLSPPRLAVACALLFPALAAAQPAVPPPATADAGIVGTVIDARTKAPLRGAKVFLGGPGLQLGNDGAIETPDNGPLTQARSTLTNTEGRFAFPDLPPGAYGIVAGLKRFESGAYGAAEPGTRGRVLNVARADHPSVTIALWPKASLAGIVRDERGEPIAGATVHVVQWRVSDGTRGKRQVGFATTNDRGAFDIDVPAGEYFLQVEHAGLTRLRVDPRTRRQRTYGFAPTLYPEAQGFQEAEAIVVHAGESRDVDIRLRLQPLVRISGVLRRPSDAGDLPESVSLTSRGQFNINYRVPVDVLGRFVIGQMQPGEYDLATSSSPRVTLWARATVLVGDEDGEITIDLHERRTINLRGHAVFEGGNGTLPPNVGVVLQHSEVDANFALSAQIQTDGQFSLAVPEGHYRASATAVVTSNDLRANPRERPEALRWSLREAWFNGRNLAVERTPIAADGEIRLVFSRQSARIDGAVTSGRDVLEAATVVMVPEDPSVGREMTRGWFVVAGKDTDATFSGEVLPGDYLVAAVRGEFPYREPAMVDALSSIATHIAIRDGDTARVSLRVLDPPAAVATPPRETPSAALVLPVRVVPLTTRPSVAGAVIGGRVVDAKTGAPIADVDVEVSTRGTRAAASTDQDGRFTLSGLAPGSYTLRASRPSWGTTVFGAAGSSPSGRTVVISATDRVEGLTIEMNRGATIEVAVVDVDGAPLEFGARVYQYQWHAGGRILEPLQLSLPNGYSQRDGRFRLSGLPPGDYVVGVEPTMPDEAAFSVKTTSAGDLERASGRSSSGAAELRTEQPWIYAPVFSPGTRELAAVQPIHLSAGEERAIAFVAERLPLATVSGTVRGGSGKDASYSIDVKAREPGIPAYYDPPLLPDVDDSGAFMIPTLPPGRYAVSITRHADDDADEAPLVVTTEIVVNGVDQEGLVFDLLPGGTVSGRLLLDGVVPDASVLSEIRLRARHNDPLDDTNVPIRARLDADGRFTLTRVPPGSFHLVVERRGREMHVRSQRVDVRETIDTGLMVEAGRHVENVELQATTAPATLSGTVRDANGRPLRDRFVVLFPAEAEGWSSSRRIFGVQLDARGGYTIAEVPYGRYLAAVAPAGLATNGWFDPAVLARLMTRATSVSIEQQAVKLDLAVTP
jgi:protocatechuate 3,4-dioxygenase beta subunit